MDLELIKRFKSQIIKKEGSDCHAMINQSPSFYFKGKKYRSARLSYLINIGKVDNDKRITTTCLNPLCVNPAHLCQLNAKEMVERALRNGYKPKKGWKMPAEHLAKMSRIHKGKTIPQEMREHLRQINLGNKHSLKTRRKMSKSRTGVKMSEGTGYKVAITKQGEKNYNTRLTKEDIFKIRYLGNKATHAEIAKMFGVVQSHISNIIRRKVWKHI